MSEEKISYREATEEIEEILEKIESGETDVDTLTSEIKRAAELLKICKERLFQTGQEVEYIMRDVSGTVKTEKIETDK